MASVCFQGTESERQNSALYPSHLARSTGPLFIKEKQVGSWSPLLCLYRISGKSYLVFLLFCISGCTYSLEPVPGRGPVSGQVKHQGAWGKGNSAGVERARAFLRAHTGNTKFFWELFGTGPAWLGYWFVLNPVGSWTICSW